MKPMRKYDDWLMDVLISYGVGNELDDNCLATERERAFVANGMMLGHIEDEYTGRGNIIINPYLTEKAKQYLEKQNDRSRT